MDRQSHWYSILLKFIVETTSGSPMGPSASSSVEAPFLDLLPPLARI